MIIRPAELSDVPAIVSMSREFYATTSYAAMTPMNDDTVARLATALVEGHVMLLAQLPDDEIVGMIGLFVAPFLFDADVLTAHEIVWWMSPAAAGRGAGRLLIETAMESCAERGASAIQMVHLSNSPPQAAALYEKLGFVHSESSYTIRVER